MNETSNLHIETKLDKKQLDHLQQQLDKESLTIPVEVQLGESGGLTSFFTQGIQSIQQMKSAIAECSSALTELSSASRTASNEMEIAIHDTAQNAEQLRTSINTIIDSFSTMGNFSFPAPDVKSLETLTLPVKNAGDLLGQIGKQIIALPTLD